MRFTVTAVNINETTEIEEDFEVRAYYAGHVSYFIEIINVCDLLRSAGKRAVKLDRDLVYYEYFVRRVQR